jgi:parallel beta-helix repeat protein
VKGKLFIVSLEVLLVLLGTVEVFGSWTARSIKSTGYISDFKLTLYSTPNPSHINESIRIFGNLTTTLTSPSNQTVLLQYSRDSLHWTNLSQTTTDNTSYFSLQVVPAYKGLLYFRATALSKTVILEQAVGDYIIAADGSGDYADVFAALKALPSTGGVICFKNGNYSMNQLINLTGRANVSLIGSGYDTRIYKTRGVTLKIANASNILIEKLHFHYLTNDAFTPIRVDGNNKNIFILKNWFTREDGPPLIDNDAIYFDITSLTDGLLIEQCYIEKAQVDAIALKSVVNGIIQNNTIIDAATEYSETASGITVEKCSNLTISKNIFMRTGLQDMAAINVFGSSKKIYLTENLIINMNRLGINLDNATDICVTANRVTDTHTIALYAKDVLIASIERNYFETSREDAANVTAIFVTTSENITIDENVMKKTQVGITVVNSNTITIKDNDVDIEAQEMIMNKVGILVNNCSEARVINNTVSGGHYFGIVIGTSPNAVLDMNIVEENMLSGIHIWSSNGSSVSRNIAKNNGQYVPSPYDRQGIDLSNSFNCTIAGNKAFDDQPTKTQLYGLVEKGISDYNIIVNNDFRYNELGGLRKVGPHTTVENNMS